MPCASLYSRLRLMSSFCLFRFAMISRERSASFSRYTCQYDFRKRIGCE
jgi:hypothetical protein